MNYIKKTSTIGALFALIMGLTFSASLAQDSNRTNNNNNRNKKRYQQKHKQMSHKQAHQIIVGQVVDANGDPVKHAKVTVMSNGQNMNNEGNQNYGMNKDSTLKTDKKGMFMLNKLSGNSHSIKVEKSHYQTWQNSVNISSSGRNNARYTSFNNPNNRNNQGGWFNGWFKGQHNNNNNNGNGNRMNNNNNNGNMANKKNYKSNAYSKGTFLRIRLLKNNDDNK
jgi:hypothetical protein